MVEPLSTRSNESDSETNEFFTDGLSVEINSIDQELKKLWQVSDQVATRASRMNLVIYSAAEHSLKVNTEIVARIARQCALRAIVVSAKPQENTTKIRAWVNAHCQLSNDGKKQRCSEQIAFQLEGDARDLSRLPSLVFSHLDSDLPLYWWWQGEFPSESQEQLFTWIDRLIFDSADWSQVEKQLYIIDKVCSFKGSLKNSLSDLNWARLLDFRLAFAHFFDPETTRPLLKQIQKLEVLYQPSSAQTNLQTLLFIGWVADRLKWKLIGKTNSGNEVCYQFQTLDASGKDGSRTIIEVVLKPDSSVTNASQGLDSLTGIVLTTSQGSTFSIRRQSNSSTLNINSELKLGDTNISESQVIPLVYSENKISNLVSEELLHSGNDKIYYRTLKQVASLL